MDHGHRRPSAARVVRAIAFVLAEKVLCILNDLGRVDHVAAAADVGADLLVHLQGLTAHVAGQAEGRDEQVVAEVGAVTQLLLHPAREQGAQHGAHAAAWHKRQDAHEAAARPEALAHPGRVVVLAQHDGPAEGRVQAVVLVLEALEEAAAGRPGVEDVDLRQGPERMPVDDLVEEGHREDDPSDEREPEDGDVVIVVSTEVIVHTKRHLRHRELRQTLAVTRSGHERADPSTVAIAPGVAVALWALLAAGGGVAATDHRGGRPGQQPRAHERRRAGEACGRGGHGRVHRSSRGARPH
mmetsp:Transcript_158425/g.508182  ORF Transcript_158425/g.508182 Transcript_158425/m.508182 type:complete len:298 (-) Transcript_158425:4-897(-)